MKFVEYKEWFVSVARLVRIVRRIYSQIWSGNQTLITGLAVFSVTLACMPYGINWLFSKAVGAFAGDTGKVLGIWLVAGALTVSFMSDIVQTIYGLLDRLLYHRLQSILFPHYYARKGGLGIDQMENQKFNDVITKAEERCVWPVMNIAEDQFSNLQNVVRLSVALAVVAAYDWRLCFLVSASLIPQFLVDVRHGNTLWSIWDAETETRRQYNETARHFRNRNFLAELKLFQNVDFFVRRMQSLLDGFKTSQEKAEKKKHIWAGVAATASTTLIGATIIAMAFKVHRGSLDLQGFIFLWSSFGGLHSTLSGALQGIARQNEWAIYAADNYAVMDAEPEAARKTGTLTCPNRVPEIVFDKVTFHYPWDDPERLILKNVSIRIRPGERLALVGINGAGKTTLVKLLCGIYEPVAGQILVDGVPLKEIKLESWRRQIALLFQEYANYHLPVRDIIRLGDTREPLDVERMQEAAKSSGVSAFCADLPNGYNTMIGKDFTGGIDLSGGQNQRMALARIWYRRGKVVILDEPTASLDALAEAKIFEEIERRPRGETVILITHRFSSIKNADHIVVLDRGSIVEEGKHRDLLAKAGIYAEMFQRQASGYV